MTIYLLVGIIGSGKSTWAKNHVNSNTFIVCKDKIREMLYGKYNYCSADEPMIDQLSKKLIIELIRSGKNIIIDECWDTINNQARENLIKFIKLYAFDADIKIIWFSSTEGNVKRRLQDNHGNASKETWEMVKQLMLDKFEPPTEYDEKLDIGVKDD